MNHCGVTVFCCCYCCFLIKLKFARFGRVDLKDPQILPRITLTFDILRRHYNHRGNSVHFWKIQNDQLS